ncbi:MAG: acyl carrier protein [Lentisphaerae bacterium]|nr:acyl carrier protein [Lentisphaerota bacterium]
MNRDEFLIKLADILQVEEEIKAETILDDLEEWDSLAKISTTAFFSNELGVKLSFSDFDSFKTVEDLMKKAGM